MKFKQFCFKEQYKLLYLALMEAFSGPSRCVTTEKFVEAYQEQTCNANCGDVVHKSSQSSEFEVILICNTDQISYKMSSSDNACFFGNHYVDGNNHKFLKPYSSELM